jgi:hypothetical protein
MTFSCVRFRNLHDKIMDFILKKAVVSTVLGTVLNAPYLLNCL